MGTRTPIDLWFISRERLFASSSALKLIDSGSGLQRLSWGHFGHYLMNLNWLRPEARIWTRPKVDEEWPYPFDKLFHFVWVNCAVSFGWQIQKNNLVFDHWWQKYRSDSTLRIKVNKPYLGHHNLLKSNFLTWSWLWWFYVLKFEWWVLLTIGQLIWHLHHTFNVSRFKIRSKSGNLTLDLAGGDRVFVGK